MANSIRVLLVDEDTDIVDVTRQFLEREDGELAVTGVTSGATALELVEQEPVDVVVTDYSMPEINGVALSERVQDHSPNTPCILYTARERADFADELERDSLVGHVRKRTGGEQYAELAALVRNVI